MSQTVSGPVPSEDTFFTAVRAILLQFMPAGIEVIRGYDNRVPEPAANNFLVIWPIVRTNLSTPSEAYSDPYPGTPSTRAITQPTEAVVQIDVHGPASGDNVVIIETLGRSSAWCEAFASVSTDITPLYADPPRMSPFENGERQTEIVWTIDLHIQVNPTVTISQQFAGTLVAGVINVDVVFPP